MNSSLNVSMCMNFQPANSKYYFFIDKKEKKNAEF